MGEWEANRGAENVRRDPLWVKGFNVLVVDRDELIPDLNLPAGVGRPPCGYRRHPQARIPAKKQ